MWNKFKAALSTGIFFVLIGVVILGIVLIAQNVSIIIEKFLDTPLESIAIFVAGAISLKIAQILRLYRARRIRAKKAKKNRRTAAEAEAKKKTETNAKTETKAEAKKKAEANAKTETKAKAEAEYKKQ